MIESYMTYVLTSNPVQPFLRVQQMMDEGVFNNGWLGSMVNCKEFLFSV